MDWYQVKHSIEVFTGLSQDALHVHLGVIAQLAAALLLRRSVASVWPWLIVLAAVGANEWFDLTYDIWPGSERQRQFDESIRDAWNTMLIPTLLLLVSRWATRLLVSPPTQPEPGD